MMRSKRATSGIKLLLAVSALIVLMLLLVHFQNNNMLITVLLAIATLSCGALVRWKLSDMLTMLIGAIMGPSMEMIAVRYGVWSYGNPSFMGIPLWLPLLWGLAVFFLTKIPVWMERVIRP